MAAKATPGGAVAGRECVLGVPHPTACGTASRPRGSHLAAILSAAFVVCALVSFAPGLRAQTRSLTISPADAELMVGESLQLAADLTDRHGNHISARRIYWSSSSRAVSVDRSGMVKATAAGKATITASFWYLRATAQITVGAPVSSSQTSSTTTSTSDAGTTQQTTSGTTDTSTTQQTTTATTSGGTTASQTSGDSNAVFLFNSDWSTATGTGSAAVRDTGKPKPWTGEIGTAWEVRNTAADGRDYPTTNYLRVGNQWLELTFDGSDGYVPAPQVGESVYFRMYYRMILAGTAGDTHGTYFDDSNANPNWGPQALGWYLIPDAGDSFTYEFSAASGQDPRYFSPSFKLSKNTTYRIEARYYRSGTNTYQLENRVYDAKGTLLFDTSNLCDRSWHSCKGYELAGRTFTIAGAGAASLTGLKIGVEGGQGGPFAEYAAVAVCKNDWCGPYRGM